MDRHLTKVARFLSTVRADNGDDVHDACEKLIVALSPDTEFSPLSILTQARYDVQESYLHELAAMNVTQFG